MSNEMPELRRLKRPKETLYHREEAERIVAAMARQSYEISVEDAEWAWQCHADDWCAGWLILPDKDEEIARYILQYMVLE